MSLSPSAQRAVQWLEQQITDLTGIRNATPRDPSFKNWRQASLTTLQRIWPGDQERSERFRRIPFSPVDGRADARIVREWYSRGCQEALRVLSGFIVDVRQNGVPEQPVEGDAAETEAAFETDFPTVELPEGDLSAFATEPVAPSNTLSEFVDDMPQAVGADTPAPPTLPSEIPAISNAAPEVHAHDVRQPKKGMGARLKDLLGFAQLSAKALTGFTREPSPTSSLPSLDERVNTTRPALEVTPLGDVFGDDQGRVAPPPPPALAPLEPEEPLAAAPSPGEPLPKAPPTLSVSLPDANNPQPGAPLTGMWPLPRPADVEDPGVTPNAAQAPTPPASPAPTPPAAPAPQASAEGSPTEPTAREQGKSVVLSRPTTLRAAIEKVSIESLLSDRYREPQTPAAPTPEEQAAGAEALEQMVDAMLSAQAVPSAPEAPATPEAPAAPAEPARPVEPEAATPPAEPARPAVVAEAPAEAAPLPAAPAASDMPVIPLFEQVRTAPAPPPRPTAPTPQPAAAEPVPPPALPPLPAPALPDEPEIPDLHELDAIDTEAVLPPAKPPAPVARASSSFIQLPPRRRSPREEPPSAEADSAVGKVDPDAFARATEDFMRSSPVLGASARKVNRPSQDIGFNDPDAIAVASMIQELARLDVPSGRQAEVRARLTDLARRIEKGELDWTMLRKAVWFAMEYPEIARRLMPVLLPWIDRAA